MAPHAEDRAFAGSIPDLYETRLVPLIFEPGAKDLASRVAAIAPGRLLEIAAGTRMVTRHLARLLPASTSIVATDLDQPIANRFGSEVVDGRIQARVVTVAG